MESVILVIHLFLALAIIGLVLLQRSEGGGLGIGGGGLGGFASAKGTANVLSRATGICAFAFFATSFILGILAGTHSRSHQGILEGAEQKTDTAVIEAPLVGEKQETGKAKVKKDGSITIPSAPIAE